MQFKLPGPDTQSRSKKAARQFKLPERTVQSRSKRTPSQFKQPGPTARPNVSVSAAQSKTPVLITLPMRSRIFSGRSRVPAANKEPVQAAAQTTQVPPPPATVHSDLVPDSVMEQPTRIGFRIFAICLAAVAVCINFSNYGPLIPALHSALHIDDGQIGLFSTLLFLGIIVANVPGGILADRLGSRTVILAALTCTTAGSLLFPVFPNFTWMIACRALIGLGAGAALVSCSHASGQLGKYEPLGQGLNGGAAQLGAGLGLFAMTFLQGLLGWQGALFTCGLLGVVALVVWVRFPKEERAIVRVKQPAENPALAIRTRAIWVLGLANMGTFGLADAIMAWISVYFINRYGLPLDFAGALGSMALFAGVIFQPLGGLLLAGLKRPVLLIRVGTALCFLSVVALAFPLHWFPLAIVGLILFSVGTTLPYAAIFSTASMVGKTSGAGSGISQALVAVLASLAAVVGSPMIGLLLEHTSSFTASLTAVGIFPTIAIVASVSLGSVLKPVLRKKVALDVV